MNREDKITADLQKGEALLWSQEPRPIPLFLAKHGVLPLLLAGAFVAVIYYATEPIGGPGAPFFLFFSVVLGTCIYQVLAPFWTFYAITNKRLIILQPSTFSTVIESYYPPDIDFIRKKRSKNGGGSLIFAAIREKTGKRTETVQIGFYGVDDVDSVEALILGLRNPKTPNQAPEPTAPSGRGSA